MKPTHIHYSKGDGVLCGAPPTHVKDKECTDEFYRTLPICEACFSASKVKRQPTVTEPLGAFQEPEVEYHPIYLIDFRGD